MKEDVGILRLLTCECREITRLVSAGFDRKLPLPHRWAVRLHLVYCTGCRRYKRQLRAIRRAARLVATECAQVGGAIEAALSPEARERIKIAVARQSANE